MATSTFNRIIDGTRVQCPGATEGILRAELFEAIKEFFERSESWIFQMAVEITGVANDYVLNTEQNAVVTRLQSVSLPRVPPPLPIQYLPMCPPQYLKLWTTETQPGFNEAVNPVFNVPRDAVLLNANTKCPIMRITWNPKNTEIWIANLSLGVSDPTDSEGLPHCPDWLITKYFTQIKDGLISRMQMHPGKSYSSAAGAAFHGRRFNEGVTEARNDIRNQFVYGGQRWAYPQGWNARRPRLP